MNKKEISEIRKLMSLNNTVFTVMRGCYVSADDHQIVSKNKDAFLSLPESEECKYLEICRKALSGKLDKTLYNLAFPLEQETEGGAQAMLYRLRECGLKDDELLDQFYDMVIESCNFEGNYYIILLHGLYDVPGKTCNDEDMFDAADDVFSFIQCCICPVSLSDASLGYQENDHRIGDRTRDWVVGMPESAFLFPLFNDRAADIHGALCYCKNEKKLDNGMVDKLLKCDIPVSPTSQKDMFASIVGDAFGKECNLAAVVDVQGSMEDLDEDQKLSTADLKKILESCGADSDALEDGSLPETEFALTNIKEKGCKIKTESISLQVDADTAFRLREEVINGQRCLVIPLDGDVEVNGVLVHPKKATKQQM